MRTLSESLTEWSVTLAISTVHLRSNMLFSGQFWSAMKGPIAGSASFEALVRREDVSVEEVLQSDEVVAAAKRGHPGLMAA